MLQPGDAFPQLSLTVPRGATVAVPEEFAGQFGVLLLFRGSWCPYCNAQLEAFQRASDALAEAGVRIAALSTDDEQATADLIARHGLTFPVGFGADPRAVADLTGAFVCPVRLNLQATGFLIDPECKIVISTYSTGAIGRLVPEDVVKFVQFIRAHT